MNHPGYVCPKCKGALERGEDGWRCPREALYFPLKEGIADFILPDRRPAVEEFLTGYRQVRREEGWGSSSVDYYRELPYRDTSRRQSRIWEVRARTYDVFLAHLPPAQGRQRLLDLGAGNGWLSVRLAERGYDAVALDINLDPEDGLSVLSRTSPGPCVVPVRAEFDALPFAAGTFDMAVFNASLHYAQDIPHTVGEALRVLRHDGRLYILDSPLYGDPQSGRAMVQEREQRHAERFGIRPGTERGEGFLTLDAIKRMQTLYRVELIRPHYDIQWRMRPIVARILGRREAAQFRIVVIQRYQRELR